MRRFFEARKITEIDRKFKLLGLKISKLTSKYQADRLYAYLMEKIDHI